MNTGRVIFKHQVLALLLLALLATALSACSVARKVRYAAFPETEMHLVGTGETIYSIAFQHELDYRKLARWNNLQEPYKLHVGQRLVLNQFRTIYEDNNPDADDSDAGSSGPGASGATQVGQTQPLPNRTAPDVNAVAVNPPPVATPAPSTSAPPAVTPSTPVVSKPTPIKPPQPVEKPPVQVAIAQPPSFPPPPSYGPNEWIWPAAGKAQAAKAPGGLDRKGIEVLGKVGEPIRAVHAGRVVYAGTGLKGYGRLLIIKHDSVYLSAYAHNSRLMVKEGDQVKTGQVIALMGLGPHSRPLVYFELRREGKPVVPTTKLPKR